MFKRVHHLPYIYIYIYFFFLLKKIQYGLICYIYRNVKYEMSFIQKFKRVCHLHYIYIYKIRFLTFSNIELIMKFVYSNEANIFFSVNNITNPFLFVIKLILDRILLILS
jgi:hypothetical protein